MKLGCPNCGDNLKFRIDEHDAFCNTCKSSFSINDLHFDINDSYVKKCSSCGAEIVTNNETNVTKCEYCGGKEFVVAKYDTEFKPVGIVPFSISKEKAEGILNKWVDSNYGECKKKIDSIDESHFYLPYSYEYQFFDTSVKSYEKNIKDVLKTGWHASSNLLFKITPFEFDKCEKINPIFIDDTFAVNVKEEYIRDIIKARKAEYYWVPVYKFIVHIHKKGDAIVLINGQTGEMAFNEEDFVKPKNINMNDVGVLLALLLCAIVCVGGFINTVEYLHIDLNNDYVAIASSAIMVLIVLIVFLFALFLVKLVEKHK